MTAHPIPSHLAIVAVIGAAIVSGCVTQESPPPTRAQDSGVIHHTRNGHEEPDALPAMGAPAWNNLVDHRLGIRRRTQHAIGSPAWMEAVGRATGVADAAGHGPDPGTAEWHRAVDRAVFGER
jgi:hypothetical protein